MSQPQPPTASGSSAADEAEAFSSAPGVDVLPDSPQHSHRGRRKASSVLLPVVLAFALVLIGFLGMWAWIGLGSDGDSTAPVGQPAVSVSAPTPSPTLTIDPSTQPTGQPTQQPTQQPTKQPTQKPTKQPTKTATAPDRSVAVVVFNQTGVGGLAANFAARMGQVGWNVVAVDNWVGTVPATTVYYRPGDEAAARTMMRDFAEVGRIRPAVAGMPAKGLTVILAGNASLG